MFGWDEQLVFHDCSCLPYCLHHLLSLHAVVNAENAGHRCEKFMLMAIRTRSAYLQELATQHITPQTVDTGSGSGLGEISVPLLMFISVLFPSFYIYFTRYEVNTNISTVVVEPS